MPLPSTMADLSVLAASCNPPGAEVLGTLGDDYHRAIQSIVRRESARGADLTVVSGILTPGNDGNYFFVTTTPDPVTGIASTWVGREVSFVFQGAVTIVHSSSLLLPGGVNISAVAGHVYRFVQEASSPIWRMVAAASQAVVSPVTLKVFTSNGTWTRPVGCRRILVQMVGPGASGAGANAGGGVGGSQPGLSAGGGGGGGGYSEALLNVESLPSASVVVPAGGVGVSGAVGAAGQGDTRSSGAIW
jgi:Ni,Fe-hydrogenase III small subunit